MPAAPGKSGGARKGAGRKSGSAWASARPPAQRELARASRINILQDRDPLAELVRLGFEAAEEGDRIKALAAAMPFVYPRLSMAVIADATPKQAEAITREMLASEVARLIARLPTIEAQAEPIETETDCLSVEETGKG